MRAWTRKRGTEEDGKAFRDGQSFGAGFGGAMMVQPTSRAYDREEITKRQDEVLKREGVVCNEEDKPRNSHVFWFCHQ